MFFLLIFLFECFNINFISLFLRTFFRDKDITAWCKNKWLFHTCQHLHHPNRDDSKNFPDHLLPKTLFAVFQTDGIQMTSHPTKYVIIVYIHTKCRKGWANLNSLSWQKFLKQPFLGSKQLAALIMWFARGSLPFIYNFMFTDNIT